MLAPHWSRDGNRLLYSAQRGRGWSVYLLDFAERKEREVFSSPGLNMAGDFFPSGTSFSLSSSRDGSPDIYLFDRSLSDRICGWGTHRLRVGPGRQPSHLHY
jgi:TolB protein